MKALSRRDSVHGTASNSPSGSSATSIALHHASALSLNSGPGTPGPAARSMSPLAWPPVHKDRAHGSFNHSPSAASATSWGSGVPIRHLTLLSGAVAAAVVLVLLYIARFPIASTSAGTPTSRRMKQIQLLRADAAANPHTALSASPHSPLVAPTPTTAAAAARVPVTAAPVTVDPQCDALVGQRAIQAWAAHGRAVCEGSAPKSTHHHRIHTTVHEVALPPGSAGSGHLVVFRNVPVARQGTGPVLPITCEHRLHGADVTQLHTGRGGAVATPFWVHRVNPFEPTATSSGVDIDAARALKPFERKVVIRVSRFDIYNPYEAMHAYVTAFTIIAALNVPPSDVQIHLTDVRARSPLDHDMWTLLSSGTPPLYAEARSLRQPADAIVGGAVEEQQTASKSVDAAVLVDTLVEAPDVTTSILTGDANRPGSLTSCKSDVILRFAAHMRNQLPHLSRRRPDKVAGAHLVILSIRRLYQRGAAQHVPDRGFVDDAATLLALQRALDKWSASPGYPGDARRPSFFVRAVDFASLSAADAIVTAVEASVIVGAHGAGLVWSTFMDPHSLLVELHSSARPASNAHYRRLAMLADLHYAAAQATDAAGGTGEIHIDPPVMDDIAGTIGTWSRFLRTTEP